ITADFTGKLAQFQHVYFYRITADFTGKLAHFQHVYFYRITADFTEELAQFQHVYFYRITADFTEELAQFQHVYFYRITADFTGKLAHCKVSSYSVEGLIKARSILRDNFGSIFMNIGDPVSVREFCGKQIDRSLHSLQPRFKFSLTPMEQQVTMDLAVNIIRTHQRNLVLSHFPLVCLVMGDHLREEHCGAALESVIARVAWLEELVNQTGACIASQDGVTRWDEVQQQIHVHSNLFTVTSDMKVELTHSESESTHASDTIHSLKLSNKVIKEALPYLAIYHYGNQAIQLLVHYAMVALIIVTTRTSSLSLESLFSRYQGLQKILQREFVFESKKSLEDMLSALEVLQNQEILCYEESRVSLDKTPDNLQWKVNLLASLLSPFLEGYK
ncbi:dihydroxyacetone phosphate acyltransferase-like, partial [Limulus polyphemus]|uniref:Dihydroxyacetone phosphate acyltransferase-like n=1 Tax=Limulus polyphemus TaxID=6850 RepID=A0ABM1BZC5_LIMPO